MKKTIISVAFIAALSLTGCDDDDDCSAASNETACRSCCLNDGWGDSTYFEISEECACHN